MASTAGEEASSEDFSISSVDQFLRENGFSIEDREDEMSSLSVEEELLSDAGTPHAEETGQGRRFHEDDSRIETNRIHNTGDLSPLHVSTTSSRASESQMIETLTPPRFVLLRDEDLLMVSDDNNNRPTNADRHQQHQSGSSTSERDESMASMGTEPYFHGHYHQEPTSHVPIRDEIELSDVGRTNTNPADANAHDDTDSLDRSMLLAGSQISPSGDGLGDSEVERDADAAVNTKSENMLLTPPRRFTPPPAFESHFREVESYRTVQSADPSQPSSPSIFSSVSTSGTGRVQDDELSDALGVHQDSNPSVLSTGRSTTTSKVRGVSNTAYQDTPSRLQGSSLDRGDEGKSEHEADNGRTSAASSQSDSIWNLNRENHSPSQVHTSQEKPIWSSQTEDMGSIGPGDDWIALNDLLRKNGLPAIRFREIKSSSSMHKREAIPDSASLFNVVQDFMAQLGRKNQIIEDLVLESNRNSKVQSRTEGDLLSSVKQNEDMSNALESAKADIVRLKSQIRETKETADEQIKKLKNSCLKFQQQLKVSEHRVKAKEVLVERMQQKLQQQVDKATLSKNRDRHVFRQLQQRDPRRANERDNQALEVISVYETQREQMQEEIDHLKSQITSLNSELRDKDNYIARKASTKGFMAEWEDEVNDNKQENPIRGNLRTRRSGGSSTASDDMLFEQLEAARREQEQVAARLRHREAVMIKKVTMIEQELLTARETIAELKEENANLTLEAESRPSIRDYRQCQRRIHQLERQVSESKLALEEAKDLNELRKYMSTKELVERDRLNHRLHLNRLNTLPRETLLEVLKDVCRILNLTDITLITPSLDKLCSVVTVVPRMEKFIRDICGFVFLNTNHNLENIEIVGGANFELEQVLPTLQQWMVEKRKLHALEGFRTAVISELAKRSIEPNLSVEANNDGLSTILNRAVHIISELVELEKNVVHHREIYSQAATELERRPQILINQIVRHFSHLFQVKSVEGVLPKINEIYLFVNEMKNFLKIVRDLLQMKPDSSVVACLNAVREKLANDGGGSHFTGEKQPEDEFDHEVVPNYVVEKARLDSRSESDGQTLAGVRQVREMSVLIRALKRELGAATVQEILPRTKRLMELLSLSIHNASPYEDD